MRRPLDIVRAFVRDEALLENGAAVLVGLSGGVDSIVMTEMLSRLGFEVEALHVNYRLRGGESEEDEQFVRAFCAALDVPLRVEHFETRKAAAEQGQSIQETARDLRYEAFERAADEAAIRRVAVAHHRGDQAETVLLHLFRGSGPEGLAGMPVHRPIRYGTDILLIRPLLCLHRREIEAYAAERGLAWREDASNEEAAYRRGALRKHLIPRIEEHFGHAAMENIVSSAELMRAYLEGGLEDNIRLAFAEASEVSAPARREPGMLGQLDLSVLRRLDSALRGRVLLEAIRRWLPALGGTRRTVEELDGLIEAQPGRRLVHPSGMVWRERERLLFLAAAAVNTDNPEAGAEPTEADRFAPLAAEGRRQDSGGEAAADGSRRDRGGAVAADGSRQDSGGEVDPGLAADRRDSEGEVEPGRVRPANEIVTLHPEQPLATSRGDLELTLGVEAPRRLSNPQRNEEYVDADRLGMPVTVRRWRPGDRFIPLGMKVPKKISDFLTDEKVPPHRRAGELVVEAGGEIVWVVGHRIADTVRLRPETRRVARLRFHPAENS